jgi:hypothetical protein
MPRKKILTQAIIPEIEKWLQEGLKPLEIAEKIGCTIGTLRVRCSQLRISLRSRRTFQTKIGIVAGQHLHRACDHSANCDGLWRGLVLQEAPIDVGQGGEVLMLNRPRVYARRSKVSEGALAKTVEQLTVMLPEGIAEQLRVRAASKGLSDSKLACTLLKTIVEDDLFEAVLDEGLHDSATVAAG